MLARKVLQLTNFLAMIAVPGLATADISGYTRIGNVSYTLQDLDPADGLTPFLTTPTVDHVYYFPIGQVQVLRQDGAANESFWAQIPRDIEDNPLTAEIDGRPDYYYRTSIAGRPSLSTVSLEAELALPQGDNLRNAGLSQLYSDRYLYTVSPHTKVTFHSTWTIDADIVGRDDEIQWFNARGAFIIWSPAIEGAQEFYNLLEKKQEIISANGSDRSLHQAIGVDISFWNTTDQPRDAAYIFDLMTEAWWRPPPAIPEPRSYGLLLAGLMALGTIAGCKRRTPLMRKA